MIAVNYKLVKDVDKIAISDACWNRNKMKTIITTKNIATIKKKFPNAERYDFRDRHHLTHAACGFYNSEFEEAAVIVVDSSGSNFEKETNVKLFFMSNGEGDFIGRRCIRDIIKRIIMV